MTESILQEWEKESNEAKFLCDFYAGDDCPYAHIKFVRRDQDRILILLARDKIMREGLEDYATGLVNGGSVAYEALAEADKILETTNKGEP